MEDPKYLAFYGLLQVSSRLLELAGDRMERESGLAPAWFEVLAQLYKGPVRMGELADSLTLSRGGATRLIARMEEAGLVEREIPKEDRRATFARITDKGRTVLEEAKPLHFAAVEEIFSRHLTEEQAAVLRDVNARVLLANGLRCGPVTDGYALEE
jgi:DNA-binding MarR family transcriptional regulator